MSTPINALPIAKVQDSEEDDQALREVLEEMNRDTREPQRRQFDDSAVTQHTQSGSGYTKSNITPEMVMEMIKQSNGNNSGSNNGIIDYMKTFFVKLKKEALLMLLITVLYFILSKTEITNVPGLSSLTSGLPQNLTNGIILAVIVSVAKILLGV
jgi:hypothetical protein